MATKTTKGNSNDKKPRIDHQARQVKWAQIAFGIFALIMVLTLVLSMVATNPK